MMLSAAIDAYVRHRQAEGSPYVAGEAVLCSMCRRVGNGPLNRLSLEQVKTFLDDPRISPITRKGKYGILGRFLRFWSIRQAMPVLGLPSAPQCIATHVPHIYSLTQLKALLAEAECCQRGSHTVDARTIRMFLLTLYATGAVVNEVLQLKLSQLDLKRSQIAFQGNQKTGGRCIPICVDLTRELARYLKQSARKDGDHQLFHNGMFKPINAGYMNERFRRLLRLSKISTGDKLTSIPCLRDFRPTFAVHRLTSWLNGGADINRMIPALSAYMGYQGLAASQQYLNFIPARFTVDLKKLSPDSARIHWKNDSQLMAFLGRL